MKIIIQKCDSWAERSVELRKAPVARSLMGITPENSPHMVPRGTPATTTLAEAPVGWARPRVTGERFMLFQRERERYPKTFGISEAERHLYLRWDGSKSNIGPPTSVSHPFGYKRTSVQIDNGEIVGVLDPVLLGETQSRLKKEPAENEPNPRAVAIADSMEKAGLAPEVKHPWADVRDRTAKATGESAERDGPLGRWPGVIGYDVVIDAGKGRTIEFKKAVSAGNPARVILRRQATVNSPAEPVAVPAAA